MHEVFCQRLREAINRSGKQQKEIAADCKISAPRLSTYVKGTNEPSLEMLSTLCRVLSVSSDYLLGLADGKISVIQDESEKETKRMESLLDGNIPCDPLACLFPDQREAVETLIDGFKAKNQAIATGKEA